MVMQYGMSKDLGLRTFGDQQGSIFLGRDLGYGRDYSEDAAMRIDVEVSNILDRNYRRAKQIIDENKDRLIDLAETLKRVETLDRQEFEALMNRTGSEDSDSEAPEVIEPIETPGPVEESTS
jgi:cell division protease FtsH